jgi:transposase InsO family protein
MHGDRAVETHLSAWIDCHSRYVNEARYYLHENLDVLIDSLLRWSVHGASRELYVDQAKIHHTRALKRACIALNIRLLHRGVGDPPPGGLNWHLVADRISPLNQLAHDILRSIGEPRIHFATACE